MVKGYGVEILFIEMAVRGRTGAARASTRSLATSYWIETPSARSRRPKC
jgi:hypothetical protein